MDTTINVWLLGAGLDPLAGERIAVCVSSSCEFRASSSFPEPWEVGLRAGRLGTTSGRSSLVAIWSCVRSS
ncbi:hypothetical protein [Cellulomonas septica]|uniref:hypothetical protein n=1 Tax=Cellulomonas septica TaxID=285080 RepID=UPI001FEC3281|nr:hypothetical protein [Cellulomonas septica]